MTGVAAILSNKSATHPPTLPQPRIVLRLEQANFTSWSFDCGKSPASSPKAITRYTLLTSYKEGKEGKNHVNGKCPLQNIKQLQVDITRHSIYIQWYERNQRGVLSIYRQLILLWISLVTGLNPACNVTEATVQERHSRDNSSTWMVRQHTRYCEIYLKSS
jgi:hypothetical protein